MTVGAEVASLADTHGVGRITDREFRRFQLLLEQEIGIYLADAKRALLTARLIKRMRALGISTFGAYLDLADRDPGERQQMYDAICTNETSFFREPRHFHFLAQTLLPRWRAARAAGQRSGRIRVLSAGCSTGQELYSVAMLLADHCAGWELELVGVDVSTKVLAVARAGVFPAERLHEVPAHYRKAYLMRGVGELEGQIKVVPELRALTRFQQANLTHRGGLGGPYDLVFCHNVLIYFRAGTKAQVMARLIAELAPGGHLFLGHAESLLGAGAVEPVLPTVYVRAGERRARR